MPDFNFELPTSKKDAQQEQAMQQVREWVRDGVLEPQDVEVAISQGYHMVEAISHRTAPREAPQWEHLY